MCSCTWNPFFICLPMTSGGGSWSYDVTVYQNWQTKMLTFQHSCDRINLLKLQHPKRQEAAMQERFETFTVLINRISRDIRRIKNQEMAAYHLRSVHVSCLYYIYSLDGVTAAELCEHCEEDKATISRALDYLETNGFIVRDSERAKRSWIRSAIPSQRTNERHSTAAFLPSAEVLRLLLKIAKNARRCNEIENKDYR